MRRASRVGRREFAPEHFAFVNATKELYHLPLWNHRISIVGVALLFILMGGYALIFSPRDQWAFPIANDRSLLLLHWAFGAPFLVGILWQRLTLPRMALAGTQTSKGAARTRRYQHRLVGRITIVCSIMASATALLLANKALAGRWVFRGWAGLWCVHAFMVGITARQQSWGAHKMWAEALTTNALSFVFGRVLLVLYSRILSWWLSTNENATTVTSSTNTAIMIEVHVTAAYYWAVVGTALFSLVNTIHCAKVHHESEKKAMAQYRWRKMKAAYTVVLPLKNNSSNNNSNIDQSNNTDISESSCESVKKVT